LNHTLKKAVAFAGCVLALLGGACSGKSTTSETGSVPLAQFPSLFSAALCDTIAPCCTAASVPYDSATCKRTATLFFQQYVDESSGPSTTYDAAAAGTCVDALKTALQSCSKFTDETTGAACSHIFVGSVPVSGACKADSECASGSCAFDQTDPTGQAGVCVAAPGGTHAKAGAACNGDCVISNGSTDCSSSGNAGDSPGASGSCYASDGLFCSSLTKVCTALAPVGAACEPQGCVAGAFCNGGTCAAQRDSGPCSDADACSAKSYCDFTTSQCLPKKADGAACDRSSQCLNDECTDGNTVPGETNCASSDVATPKMCAGDLH
jgi:hypothetical protein